MNLSQILLYVFVPGIIAAMIGFYLPGKLFHTTFMGSPSSDAFVFACIPVIAFFLSIWVKARGEDKKGIGALLFIFMISVIFWAIYYQNFTAYTLWAEQHTDRTVSTRAVEKVADFMGQLQKVNTTPRKVIMVNDYLVPVKDDSGNLRTTLGPDPYFNNIPKANWPPPGQNVKLVNTEIFESIGPLFIVTLTPLLVAWFQYLRKRKREPTTASKFGIALFLSGLSSIVMLFAVLSVPSIYQFKVSPGWLWGTYFVITAAEIFLSPIGLSLVSKLAGAVDILIDGRLVPDHVAGQQGRRADDQSSLHKFPDKRIVFLYHASLARPLAVR